MLSKALHSASCHGNNQGQILLKPGMYSCNFGKNKKYDTESKVMYVMDTQQCQWNWNPPQSMLLDFEMHSFVSTLLIHWEN